MTHGRPLSRVLRRLLLVAGAVPPVRRLSAGVYLAVARLIAARLGRWPCVWAVDLRGSAAVHRTHPGRSDVDLHVVVHPMPARRELVWLGRFASEFARLRRAVPLLEHVTVMSRADKEAAIRVGIPYSVGAGGISRRLIGPAALPAAAEAQRRAEPFLDAWFSLLALFSFYPRVAFSPAGAPRPVHEHQQNLDRVLSCYERLWRPARPLRSIPRDIEHDALGRYVERRNRGAVRRALWLRDSFERNLADWVDLLIFWSDAARMAKRDDYERLMLEPVSGQPWDRSTGGGPPRSARSPGDDLARLEEAVRRHGALGIRVGHHPWQEHDRRCFVVIPEPVEIEQVAAIVGALRRALGLWAPNGLSPTFPLPILVTEAMFDLAFAFPKAPLDFLREPVSARQAWLYAHGAQIEILRQVEMLRSKTVDYFAGHRAHLHTRLRNWAFAFFPAARLFVEEGLLCTSAEQALDCYVARFDGGASEVLSRYSALFAARDRSFAGEPEAVEIPRLLDDLYPCLQPLAVRLGQRLREAPRRTGSSFDV